MLQLVSFWLPHLRYGIDTGGQDRAYRAGQIVGFRGAPDLSRRKPDGIKHGDFKTRSGHFRGEPARPLSAIH